MKYALLVIDVQRAIFAMKQPVYSSDDLIRNLKSAIRIAHANGIRVVFSRHENGTFLVKGTQGHEIIGEMDVRKSDIMIEKRRPDVFDGTSLDAVLKEDGIGTLIVAGLISNGCVREACVSALKRGYEVCLLQDAHSTFYKNAERIIEQVNREMEAKGVRLMTVDQIPGAT